MSAFTDGRIESVDLLPERGDPVDHSRFYRSPNNIAALDTHRNCDGSGKGVLSNLELVETSTVLNVKSFPVLCYSYHPEWPILSWGLESLIKSNSLRWPHPIA